MWGKTWIQAKTQAECYDYLFEAAVKMRQLGIDASQPPAPLIANGATNGHSAPVAKKRKTGQVGGEEACQNAAVLLLLLLGAVRPQLAATTRASTAAGACCSASTNLLPLHDLWRSLWH